MGRRRANPKFPCGKCATECEDTECLFCEVCVKWFHSECEGISDADFQRWGEINGDFLCTPCRQDGSKFDYLRGITRLSNAAKSGIESLTDAVERELLLLGTDRNVYTTETGCLEVDIDDIAYSILKQYHNIQGRPLKTTGDGDCLFNAISILVGGSENLSVELRYKTTLMMVKEEASIMQHENKASIMLLSPDYEEATLACAKLSSFSSTWTIMALAKVIRRPIQSIYPSVNGEKDLAFRCLNTIFDGGNHADPIMIMWTSTSKLSGPVIKRRKTWTPNHFVPVISTMTSKENTSVDDSSFGADFNPARASTPTEEWELPKKTSRRRVVCIPEASPVSNSFDIFEDEHFHMLSDRETTHDVSSEKTQSDHELSMDIYPSMSGDSETTSHVKSAKKQNDHELSMDICPSNDNRNDHETGHVSSDGPYRAHLYKEKFLTWLNVLELLTNTEGSLPNVPVGIKNNIYFIVDNRDNERRTDAGLRREFWDDCGSWCKNVSPTTYILPTGGKLINIIKRQGQFFIEKFGRRFELIDPQPALSDLIIINRVYTKLKADPSYKRRISWIGSKPASFDSLTTNVALYEYTGTFPGRLFHGHTKHTKNKQKYIRAKPSLKRKASEMLRYESAKNVHDELNNGTDIHDTPRNLKQMQNMKHIQEKKTKKAGREDFHLNNLADHLLHVENKVYRGDIFIRSVSHLHSGPSVILYTDEQIQDIKRFCCVDEPTVLGVDKTYNLGQLYLTTTVFKNLAVIRSRSGESPIFLGPSFLHSKSDFQTFNVFFSHLASHLTDHEIQQMVVGTDDEIALRKSISRCFPKCTQTVCTRHLKNNVKDYLNHKVGVKDKDKAVIVQSLFGENGLSDADSTIMFDHRLEGVLELVDKKALGFKSYLQSRIIPMIKNQVNFPKRIRRLEKDWTNNNAESMNNILKVGTNHKLEDMTDLIGIIHRIVQSQYKDCEKAIAGMGNYVLAPAFVHHKLSVDVWCQKSDRERECYLKKFYSDRGRTSKCISSSNGFLTIPKSPNGGKKPHQRKRPVAERAVIRKKHS